jgi:hypothetical protein
MNRVNGYELKFGSGLNPNGSPVSLLGHTANIGSNARCEAGRDEMLGPDLPRGRVKSNDGDLDVDDEGSE